MKIRLHSIYVLRIFLFLILFYWNFENVQASLQTREKYCSSKSIYNCFKPLEDTFNIDLTKENLFRIGPFFAKQDPAKFCKLVSELKNCTRGIKECGFRTSFYLENARNFLKATHLFCSMDPFNQSSVISCFSGMNVKIKVRHCNNYALTMMSVLSDEFIDYENASSIDYLQLLTLKYRDYLSDTQTCKHYFIVGDCGLKVADWYDVYNTQLNVPLWNNYTTKYNIKLGYMLLFIAFFAGCLLLLYFFIKNHRDHLHNRLNFFEFKENIDGRQLLQS